MTGPDKTPATLEHGFLLLLLAAATLAFAWLIGPLVGAILWGVIAAILFAPLNGRLLDIMPGRRNLAAAFTLLIIVAVAIIPAMALGAALMSQASIIYGRVQSGDIDLGRAFFDVERHLPDIVQRWLAGLGVADFDGARARVSEALASSFRSIASQILDFGQGALNFLLSLGVMLYLTFFLLRDGPVITASVERSLPLPAAQRRLLIARFVTVVRATIKGSLIVAILQGLIGGLTFWTLGIGGALLWGVAMGLFSLFPAIGTAFIWLPVAAYLFATGDVWQGVALLLCGFFIISSVDNLVRPILVGRDAGMPDFVVLIATLGGFALIGFNGFVIGPMIAAIFIAVWQIFGDEKSGHPTEIGVAR